MKKLVAGAITVVVGLGVASVAVGQPLPIGKGSGAQPQGQGARPGGMPINLPAIELTTLRSVSVSCANEDMAQERICDTNNACTVTRASCFPYHCDASARTCAASCDSNSQCSQGARCDGGRCELAPQTPTCSADRAFSINPSGTRQACSVYLCDLGSGTCPRTCTAASDCVPGNVCDSTSHCVRAGR